MASSPTWLRDALALPLFGAQSREDSLQDLDVVRALGRPARVLVAATTPCTAAALAGLPQVIELQLAGSCAATLALSRAKLRLLETRAPAERLSVLGYGPHQPLERRCAQLRALLAELELAPDACGPLERVARLGLDYAGRLERAWLALRHDLSRRGLELTNLLLSRDLSDQAQRLSPHTKLGAQVDAALRAVLAPAHAAKLAGLPADHPWARELAPAVGRALRGVFERLPAAGNPLLARLLAGAAGGAPWQSAPRPERMPRVGWTQAPLAQVLAEEGPGFDTIHLGDALERLDPQALAPALASATRRLLPGGALVVHRLTGAGDLPAPPGLRWDADYAERLGQEDRSPLTQVVAIGRREG